jgi:hypothetical protein
MPKSKLLFSVDFFVSYVVCILNAFQSWCIPGFQSFSSDWAGYLNDYTDNFYFSSVVLIRFWASFPCLYGFLFWVALLTGLYACTVHLFLSSSFRSNSFYGLVLMVMFAASSYIWLSFPQTELFRSWYLLLTSIAYCRSVCQKNFSSLTAFALFLSPMLLFSHKYGPLYDFSFSLAIAIYFIRRFDVRRSSVTELLFVFITITSFVYIVPVLFGKLLARYAFASYIESGGADSFHSSSFFMGASIDQRLLYILILLLSFLLLYLLVSVLLGKYRFKSFRLSSVQLENLLFYSPLLMIALATFASSFNLLQLFRHLSVLIPSFLYFSCISNGMRSGAGRPGAGLHA